MLFWILSSPPGLVLSPPVGEGHLENLVNHCGAVPKRVACTWLSSAEPLGCQSSTLDAFDTVLVGFDTLASCDPAFVSSL